MLNNSLQFFIMSDNFLITMLKLKNNIINFINDNINN